MVPEIGARVYRGRIEVGSRIHGCSVAVPKATLRLLFEELLRRRLKVTVTGPVERTRSTIINGFVSMPVEFRTI
jgi:hypothetical protein